MNWSTAPISSLARRAAELEPPIRMADAVACNRVGEHDVLDATCLVHGRRQFVDVEPNSGLGGALAYFDDHWQRLTLFLREPGAPLDSNVVERALKKPIRHRRNSLFYRSERGAMVGDCYMSLVHTAEHGGHNAFEHLVALIDNADLVAASPADWMPWNYAATLGRAQPP